MEQRTEKAKNNMTRETLYCGREVVKLTFLSVLSLAAGYAFWCSAFLLSLHVKEIEKCFTLVTRREIYKREQLFVKMVRSFPATLVRLQIRSNWSGQSKRSIMPAVETCADLYIGLLPTGFYELRCCDFLNMDVMLNLSVTFHALQKLLSGFMI